MRRFDRKLRLRKTAKKRAGQLGRLGSVTDWMAHWFSKVPDPSKFEVLVAQPYHYALLGPDWCAEHNIVKSERIPLCGRVFFGWDLGAKDTTTVVKVSYTPDGGMNFEYIDPQGMYVR
jgi:hypothetical protein